MPAPKKIKEDPPELESKVDKVAEKPVAVEEKAAPAEEAFKDAPTPDVSPDVAALIEQNKMLMAKVEELTAKPESKVKEKSGVPVLNRDEPIVYQRREGAAWMEQNGHRFSYKNEYIGEVEEVEES